MSMYLPRHLVDLVWVRICHPVLITHGSEGSWYEKMNIKEG